MIHIHSIDFAPRPKRCDVRVSRKKMDAIKTALKREIAEEHGVATAPKHFEAHQQFKQHGEVA